MLRSTTLCWNWAHVATRRFRNSSVSRIGIRYTRSCIAHHRLYQPPFRIAWSKNQRGSISEIVADAEAATGDSQHRWRHVCLPARQCAGTSCSWHSRASAPWDTPVHQSWHVASQVLASTRQITASGACCKSACIEYQSAIWTSCGSVLLRHGLIFSRAWRTMQLISGEKRLKASHPCRRWSLWTLAMTLLAWHSSCRTSQPVLFRATNVWRNATLPSVRSNSLAFYKVVHWHFFRCGE